MAGIEKICEYSGEYPDNAWRMHSHKHNLIQVLPQYRHHFNHQPAVLYYWPNEVRMILKSGGSMTVPPKDKYFPSYARGAKICMQYYYSLHVPSVPGEVSGWYLNWAFDFPAVKHKIRKLLCLRGTRQLKIIKLRDWDHYEQLKDEYENSIKVE